MPIPGAKKGSTLPDKVRAFTFFGVDIDYEEGKDQACGTCPFCGTERKFFVSPETGQWDCKRNCGSGNIYTFLNQFYDNCSIPEDELNALAEDRQIDADALGHWGLRMSFLESPISHQQDWVVPAYNAEGKLCNLYRRVYNSLEKRWYLNGPKGLSHGLFGLQLLDQDKDDIFMCEGVWDGAALWHALRTTKSSESNTTGTSADISYLPTRNLDLSLLKNANVIATPSSSVFSDTWAPIFAEKNVYICCHNDHPNGKPPTCAAFEGTRRAVSILAGSVPTPKELHYLKWGDGKYTVKDLTIEGYDEGRKHGFDIRDLLCIEPSGDTAAKYEAINILFSLFEGIPPSWVQGAKGSKSRPVVPTIACERFSEVIAACKEALVMTDGMVKGISCMLAVASCVPVGDDQLWMKFIGPPATGKTTLAEGLMMARKFAVMKSITTGLHSGYKDKETDGEDDFSLMKQIKDMAVVIKDGDTLMKSDSLPRILSELRDAFDRSSSTHFRNRVIRTYEDWSFALLICGTKDIRGLDATELGARFIDCVIMTEPEMRSIEHEVQDHKAESFINLMAQQATLNGSKTEGPAKQHAKQVIGGYLEYLRKNMLQLISEVQRPNPMYVSKVKALARIVAKLRARPANMRKTDEEFTREMATRLTTQFMKLMYGLAVVLNKKVIDDEVVNRVVECGFDTCAGKTLRITHLLFDSIERKMVPVRGSKRKKLVITEGLPPASISTKAVIEIREITKLLIFLEGINVLERHVLKENVGLGSRFVRWRLTADMKADYLEVSK
jgi:hypothetical protein